MTRTRLLRVAPLLFVAALVGCDHAPATRARAAQDVEGPAASATAVAASSSAASRGHAPSQRDAGEPGCDAPGVGCVRVGGSGDDADAAGRASAPESPAQAFARSLPEVTRKPVGASTLASTAALLAEGDAFVKSRAYDDAIAKYRETLTVDAGQAEARYSLASALVAKGDVDAGLAVLQQFSEAGCPDCLFRVLTSRQDRRWSALRDDARYQEMVAEAARRVPSFEQAAEVMRGWVLHPDAVDPPVIIEPRHEVEVTVECRGCQPGARPAKVTETLRGVRRVARWYKQLDGSASARGHVIVGDTVECKRGCCEYKRERADERADRLYLDRVCFQSVDEGPLWVTSMTLTESV